MYFKIFPLMRDSEPSNWVTKRSDGCYADAVLEAGGKLLVRGESLNDPMKPEWGGDNRCL